jgi:uncharacterized membrane protein YbhN (UPF0104 family)
MLSRLGYEWKRGVVSVLIDRGVAVAALFAYGFIILMFPSALTALARYYGVVTASFAFIPLAVIVGLICVPWIAPLLGRWRYTQWLSSFAYASHNVLLKSRAGITATAMAFAAHTLTILCIWCIGQAIGISLPMADVAVLFVLMVGITLIPISVSGWGLREVAVVSLLASHGVPKETALSLSVMFGLVLILASLPGAIIWAVFSPRLKVATGATR